MWTWPHHAEHPRGGLGLGPPSRCTSSTRGACSAVPGLPSRGGLQPCRPLARINKQVLWICGVLGPAAAAGRRLAALPKATPQGAAGRRSVANHGPGTRAISIAVQRPERETERCPCGAASHHAAPQHPAPLPGAAGRLPPQGHNTHPALCGSPTPPGCSQGPGGSSSASPGSVIHLSLLPLGLVLKHRGGSARTVTPRG